MNRTRAIDWARQRTSSRSSKDAVRLGVDQREERVAGLVVDRLEQQPLGEQVDELAGRAADGVTHEPSDGLAGVVEHPVVVRPHETVHGTDRCGRS